MIGRLVVTGVDGFVGRHVARIAARQGIAVTGISRTDAPDSSLQPDLVEYISADLTDAWPVSAPTDAPIVHLAGLAAVGPSFDSPQTYIASNSAMVSHMCEALLAAGAGSTRVVGVSTGAVYAHDERAPLRRENDPVAFSSPYVVSKVLVENQLAYYRGRGLSTVVARPFNHIGPGQGPGFILPDLLTQLARLRVEEPLRVGNLDTRRDYTDVRDVAAAYVKLATTSRLEHTVYNVASGKARSGRELLDAVCTILGRRTPSLELDVTRVRATDPAVIVGDARRMSDEFDWHATVPLERTLHDVVASPRQREDHEQ